MSEKIRLLLLDCDGVLTDGRLYFSANREELKVFDVQDGQGIVNWLKAGNIVGIISGRSSPIVERRARELGIQFVRQNVRNKLDVALEISVESGIDLLEAVYVGDDIPDIRVMEVCGLGVAVANAVDEVKEIAGYVTDRNGGRGAVREVVDMLLKDR